MPKSKKSDRGYWVSKLFYYQSIVYGFIYSFRFLSPTFFSATNPALEYGGMFDDKKSDVYRLVPEFFLPRMVLLTHVQDAISEIGKAGLSYPMIIKPDIGFKGFMVTKVDNENQLKSILPKYGNISILIQEFIDLEREFSILIYRYPKSGRIGVSSFIEKTFPTVTGDGQRTFEELIDNEENPFLKKDWIKKKYAIDLNVVLDKDEVRRIDDIGNYSRGAGFHSMNHLINESLELWACRFMTLIKGIDFCRVDLKSDSVEDLLSDKYLIVEVNGIKSEPLHTYDSRFSYFEIMKDVHTHWMIVKDIVKERLSMAYSLPPFVDGFRSWWIAHNLVK